MNGKDQPRSLDRPFEPASPAESLPIGTAAPSDFALPPTTASRRSVDLQIDELILDGFSLADRHTIGEAVERELTQLFTEQGVPPTITYPSETAEVDGSLLETDPVSNADAIGARVARAIYGGLGK